MSVNRSASEATAINFGLAGPVQKISWADDRVRAEIRYRIAHDRDFDSGPAAVSPSMISGMLTVVSNGVHRKFDLARLLPILTDRIVLPSGTADGCGAVQVMSRHGNYLVLQAVVAEKGCTPIAVFVDLTSGKASELVVVDHVWDRRFDHHVTRVQGQQLRVSQAEHIAISMAVWTGIGKTSSLKPWRFGIIRAADRRGRSFLLAFEVSRLESHRGDDLLPRAGSTITLSTSGATPRELVRYFSTEPVLRFDVLDERRHTAEQTPTPKRDGEKYTAQSLV